MKHQHLIRLIVTIAQRKSVYAAVARCCWHEVDSGYDGCNKVGFFVDNAAALAAEAGISPAQFAGALGALQKAGKYEPSYDPEYNGHYGYMIRD